MRHLVLGIDENETRGISLVEKVLGLFDTDDICVHLVHDFIDNPEGASISQVSAVRVAEDRFESAGVTVELHEKSGAPAASIVDVAEEVDAAAICVAGRKRSPAGKLLFGSVTQQVILDTVRPVLVTSADEDV